MSDDPRVQMARRRVAAMEGFYLHLGIFAAVIVVLAIIDLMSGPEWWVQWPLAGWGIGVLGHAIGVFGLPGSFRLFSREWEDRKVKEIVDKMRG